MVVPRKDTTDTHRNRVQTYCHRLIADTTPIVVGHDPLTREHWSMSRALNDGRTRVDTPAILITPADYVITPEMIARAEEMLDDWPWWGPYRGVWQIPRPLTLRCLQQDRDLPPHRRGCAWWGLCIAATAVRLDVWDDVGGMDPRFEGWGPEDAALRMKLRILHGEVPAPEFTTDEMWCRRPRPQNQYATCSMYAREYEKIATPQEARAAIDNAAAWSADTLA